MRIGFIGLGTMGAWMALNIRKAGYDLAVYDIRREAAGPHLDAGANWADSPGELARTADVVFTSLPGPREMEAVGLSNDGLLGSMRRGTAWFDLTTNSATVVRRIGESFQEQGIDLLDAPVSGGPAGARSGKLALYVGGDKAVFDRHKKLLDAIGNQVMYVGPIGAGTVVKLAHNCAGFIVKMATAEVFALGVKAGVELHGSTFRPTRLRLCVASGNVSRNKESTCSMRQSAAVRPAHAQASSRSMWEAIGRCSTATRSCSTRSAIR